MNAGNTSGSSFMYMVIFGLAIVVFILKNNILGNKLKTMERDKVVISIWIPILIIELFNFYNVVHSPHDISELIFHVTLIVVSLIVGVTLILVYKNKGNE